jgi:anti-anti-sigma regulatory factor
MTIAVLRKVDNESVASILREVEKSLKRAQGELVIDFSSVARLDGVALSSLAEFASKADTASVKVILRGVNVDVFKVLVLMKLNSRFSFVN